MSPIFLKLGVFVLPWYTVMAVFGMLGARRVVRLEAERLDWDRRAVNWLVVKCMLLGLLGGHLLYAITRWDLPSSQWWSMLTDVGHGQVWFGGFLVAWAYCDWFARAHRIDRFEIYDVAAFAVLIAQPIGRMGCLLEGCCYGRPTTLPWGVIMNNREYGGTPLHPTAIYEALYLLGVFVFLWARRKSNVTSGMTAAWYLLLVPAGRIVVEFFRGDTVRGFVVGNFSTSQCISVCLLAIGVLFWFARVRTHQPRTSALHPDKSLAERQRP